ncbi:MAG: pirin family protein [Bacteriovoracia bacterium]
MIKIRRSAERGQADHGWLKSHHTFSFAGYYDPKHMGFRNLRVINQGYVAGGGGFPTHPHRDMEIVTYMVEGELTHRDTMGNQEVIRRGEIQYMCAGTGVAHSEYNANTDKTAHLLQIWIEPQATGLKPAYGQKSFLPQFAQGELVRVLSPDGIDGSVAINQDANLWVGWLKAQKLKLPLKKERHGWLQIVSGVVKIHNETLVAGDAVAISGEADTEIETSDKTELLFFDLT